MVEKKNTIYLRISILPPYLIHKRFRIHMDSWDKFLRSLSEGSHNSYTRNAKKFLSWIKLDCDSAMALADLELEKKIEDFVYFLKDGYKGNPNSVHTIYYAVRKLAVVNRKNCNWTFLQTCLPRMKAPGGRKAYTNDHIRRMISSAKTVRDEAWIQFIACTDIRPGSAKEMNVKDLVEAENGYVITVYNEDVEEYKVGIIPEARKAIDNYFEKRNLMGYPVTPDSPLWTKSDYHTRATTDSLKEIARKLAELAGIRAKRGINMTRDKDSIQANNGFRKRFMKSLVDAKIHEKDIEFFMGHYNLQDQSYYRDLSNQDVWEKYYPAIQKLTINETEKLRLEKNELEQANQDIEELREEFRNYKKIMISFMSGIKDPSIEHLVE